MLHNMLRAAAGAAGYDSLLDIFWGSEPLICGGMREDLHAVSQVDGVVRVTTIWGDDEYIYVGFKLNTFPSTYTYTRRVRKYHRGNLGYIAETADIAISKDINSIIGDDTYIYVSGLSANGVGKYLKSNMSHVGGTVENSYGEISDMCGDHTHIYVGNKSTLVSNMYTVRKYLKSDMSYVGQSDTYGGPILSLHGDDTYIYAGGSTTNTVRKYLKSDMSYVGESDTYGGPIYSLHGDDTYIYAGGLTTNTVRKYLKSDMSYVGESDTYGGFIYSLHGDDTYIYAGGSTTNTVRKYLKSNMGYVGESDVYGGAIYAIWGPTSET